LFQWQLLYNQHTYTHAHESERKKRERTIDLCCFGWKIYFFKIFVRDLSIRLRENFTIYSRSVFDALSNDVIFINLAWDQNFRTSWYVNGKCQRARPCTDRKITIFSLRIPPIKYCKRLNFCIQGKSCNS
jgi:hypothetical protein